ncbi:hypothetical protein H6F78_09185 [Coleofasciculus sp. FACHB-64]|uniref:hypothetical protein n=1 Tax=Cyanophyceae TaxID=3028117 RepID=UPI00168549DA|nr:MULTISPECIES: hypothetical protein [unclassified Coleofasciculus]MBD1838533.1 hypothetical protein [Coleofasciculus sp. FACHB-501]MBD1900776.1 hypothetical protein [Coleofasciculus sp. FACHB-125]MBD2045768.1 hypothetical protein [Coleofasciculus sp. FACHB-64]
MFANKKLINSLVSKIGKIEKETLAAMRDGRVEQEPAITDRLLGVMEYVLNGQTTAGVKWTVKTLTDRGRGSQESEFGADFLAALELSLDGYQVAKGFLAQSKLVEPSQTFNSNEVNRLKEQCEKMLSHSSASFVFLYSQQSGIVIVPALEVLAARDCNPHELISRPMKKFYQEHFECFIGDRDIRCATPNALEGLRTRYQARQLVFLSGSQENESVQLDLFNF